jgi:hypothetical protein
MRRAVVMLDDETDLNEKDEVLILLEAPLGLTLCTLNFLILTIQTSGLKMVFFVNLPGWGS